MPNKGFSDFRALSSASNFVSVDNNVLRNLLLGIAATVSIHAEKPVGQVKYIVLLFELLNLKDRFGTIYCNLQEAVDTMEITASGLRI